MNMDSLNALLTGRDNDILGAIICFRFGYKADRNYNIDVLAEMLQPLKEKYGTRYLRRAIGRYEEDKQNRVILNGCLTELSY